MSSARRRACGTWLAVAALGLSALASVVATAHIPAAERVLRAVAQRNRAAGRDHALQLELDLFIGTGQAGPPSGSGVLVTHPTGLARLELRGRGGLVERHLLQGTEYRASRNALPLFGPRRFLPPLFLLQTPSELGLRAGLAELGADVDAIGLAPCGESDCYVIGDPRRVPPPLPPPPGPEAQAEAPPVEGGDDFQPFSERPPPEPEPPDPATTGPFATIWVDTETFDVKRIDGREGVRVWVGPPAAFGRVEAPSWVRIDEPGRQPVRLEVQLVSEVDAPAAAFTESWLDGPPPPAPAGGPAAPPRRPGGEGTPGADERGPDAPPAPPPPR